MLLGGDEFARTQHGNNNAWCQDSEISWFGWDWDERGKRIFDFTKRLITLRREHPVFRRRQFLEGTDPEASGLPDVWWFRADGRRMTKRDWNEQRTVGMFLNGQEIAAPGPRGERVEDDSFLMLFNAHHEDVTFTLPTRRFGAQWEMVLTTADPTAEPGLLVAPARTGVPVIARSIMLLKRVSAPSP
jgi:glycogen operon protein